MAPPLSTVTVKNSGSIFKTTEDINKMSIKKVPKTTTYSTQWAMNNFDCWRLARNSRSVDEKVPENLSIEMRRKQISG